MITYVEIKIELHTKSSINIKYCGVVRSIVYEFQYIYSQYNIKADIIYFHIIHVDYIAKVRCI